MTSPFSSTSGAVDGRAATRRPSLVVSVHDVAPPSAAAAMRWAELVDPLGVPLSILVVPGPWRGTRLRDDAEGRQLFAWLQERRDRGDEISLHGWCHRADVPGSLPRRAVGAIVARGAAEMWGLDHDRALQRTADGLEVLDSHHLTVTGSTPPGWLSSGSSRRAFREAGLQYVTDHGGLVDLASGRRWNAPALCHRPAALVGAQRPGAVNATLEELGRRTVLGAPLLARAGRPVRIALHPDDLLRPRLAEAAVRAIRRTIEAGAEATTYAAVLEGLRSEGPTL